MAIKEFKSGYWYKYTKRDKTRPGDWSSEGNMDFMLDGMWHQCNDGDDDTASFFDCSDESREWDWESEMKYMKSSSSQPKESKRAKPIKFKQAPPLELGSRGSDGATVQAIMPIATLKDVILPIDTVNKVKRGIVAHTSWDLVQDQFKIVNGMEKGNGTLLLFAGDSGTGKTLMAEAIAHHLGMRYALINSGNIESYHPGVHEKNMNKTLSWAERHNVLLIFDEAESLLNKRGGESQKYSSSIMDREINNTLVGLERFSGTAIFTTNRGFAIDAAVRRRMSDIIVFPRPDTKCREQIWKHMLELNKKLEFKKAKKLYKPSKNKSLPDVDFKALAKKDVCGGSIKQVVMNSLKECAYTNKKISTTLLSKEIKRLDDFDDVFTNSQLNRTGSSDFKHDEGNICKAIGIKKKDMNVMLKTVFEGLQDASSHSEAVELLEKLVKSKKTKRMFVSIFIAGLQAGSGLMKKMKDSPDSVMDSTNTDKPAYFG